MHILNDRLLQRFIHLPDHRSRLIFDLDSTVVTVFGHQEEAAVGYNPRIAASALTTHCCALKLIPPTFGIPSYEPATPAHGKVAPSCWTLAL
jgi:hypothetical protein